MTFPRRVDVLVVGGGVVGLAIARALRRCHPGERVAVLEKEPTCGWHASGRNSGVLHAGFYYTADSLKAKLTRRGNAELTVWCEEQGVPVRRCGKLVVATRPREIPMLDELRRRGEANGVELVGVDPYEARQIEPRVRTVGPRALFSPTTSSVDPGRVMQALAHEVKRAGVVLLTATAWQGRRGQSVLTSGGEIEAGYLVNAAGLHADRIAHAYGFGRRYRVLPFAGLYLEGRPEAPPLSCHVYPVPDVRVPFLGVHLTAKVDGHVTIGPTALPAPWLEAYQPLSREGSRCSWSELSRLVPLHLRHLVTHPGALRLAARQGTKVFRWGLVREARRLASGVEARDFAAWGRPGIRAQLFDTERGQLEMDFVFEGDDRSMHVLNAVSPAFTCALPFADLVVDAIASLRD